MTANLIADPFFETFGKAGSRWEAESHGAVVHQSATNGDILQIEQAGAVGVGWHGELRYAPFPVRKGELLDVSFSVRFSHPARLSVWIGQYRRPWRSLLAEESRFDGREIGSEWRDLAFRAEIVADEPEARLNFVFGERDGLFALRCPSLCRVATALFPA